MAAKSLRGAIVGASTLRGKELADELNDASAWDLTLLDTEDAQGQVTSAGDEPLIIQPITADSFTGIDIVFFAGDAATTRTHWVAAHAAGAAIVDLTSALDNHPNTLIRSPWLTSPAGPIPDLTTSAVVSAHPVAIMLALAAQNIATKFKLTRMAATVLQPASEQGSAGVDEMHQQTVALLTFQPLTKDIYDAQVAFNLTNMLGNAARLDLATTSGTIQRHLAAIAPPTGATTPIAVQLLQAPVFHGYTASVYIELATTTTEAELATALTSGILQADASHESPTSNDSAIGQPNILATVQAADATQTHTTSFWLWLAADNLRLAAHNAATCATELSPLRPASGIN